METAEMLAVSEEFSTLAPQLRRPDEAPAALVRMTELVVKQLPGADGACVQTRRQRPRVLAASSPSAGLAAAVQLECAQGPSIDCLENGQLQTMNDLEAEWRWTSYRDALAAKTAIRSQLCVPLDAPAAACLSVYSDEPQAFDEQTTRTAVALAGQVSTLVALYEADDEIRNLKLALDSNRRIGIAIGVLMALHGATETAAFELLKTASQQTHYKLRDIADTVIETGALPGA